MSKNDKIEDIVGLLVLILCVIAMFISCGKRPAVSTNTETIDYSKESIATNQTSKIVTDRNKAIIDSLIVVIGRVKTSKPECDSICQETLDHALQQLNHLKISGDNRFGVLYDKHTKLLKAYANIAETLNQVSEVKKDSFRGVNKIITKRITQKIPVEYTPDYMRYSAYFGWACMLFVILWISKKVRSWISAKSLL
jgi:hypothetical protein